MVQLSLPPGLTVDTFGGTAWLGITPFSLRDVRPPHFPAIPWFSHFLGCTVRTYVFDAQGRPGVWYYSLDVNRWLVVKLARIWFHLPYHYATVKAVADASGAEVDFSVCRWGGQEESRFRYRASGPGREAAVGSLEFFLAERYRFFSQDEEGQLFSTRIAHVPHQLGSADVALSDDRLLQAAGFDPDGQAPDHSCVLSTVDVEVFSPERVEAKTHAFAADSLGEEAMPA